MADRLAQILLSRFEEFAIWVIHTFTTDEITMWAAKVGKMKQDGLAAKHLVHYLEGSGTSRSVDLAALVKEDGSVRSKLEREIAASIKRGLAFGSVPIGQGVYSNRDWHYALGAVNVNWKLGDAPTHFGMHKSGNIKIRFNNVYQWHPKEVRVTQLVHISAERLKQKGAQEFTMIGEEATLKLR